MPKGTTKSRPVCKECGKIILSPKRRNQQYCNSTCREEYYKKHYFIKTVVRKTCPNCGTSFATTKPTRQIYCTPECREEARLKRLDAMSASVSAERTTYLGERVTAFERDGFKCTVCGRGVKDGAILDTVEEDTSLVTVCTDCKAGKEVKQ